MVLIGVLVSYVEDWILLVSISAIPILTLLCLSFILQEDPYFLLNAGRIE
jgi:hypothetical protein